MDKSAPTYTTPGTYIDIENRIIDKYLPHIGVYGFAVYVVAGAKFGRATTTLVDSQRSKLP
jgi:hypothetical protein